eukprot:RCo029675
MDRRKEKAMELEREREGERKTCNHHGFPHSLNIKSRVAAELRPNFACPQLRRIDVVFRGNTACALKQLCQHAPHSAASDGLNGGDVGVHNLVDMGQDDLPLRGRESAVAAGGHHQQPAAVQAGQLQNIAAELVDLGHCNVHHGVARTVEAVHKHPAFLRTGDACQADDSQAGAHGHHDVGVVDGPALDIHRAEADQTVPQLGGPRAGNFLIAPLGQRGVRDLVHSIHHQHPSALQEVREVAGLPHRERELPVIHALQLRHNILPPLIPAGDRLHGVKHHGALPQLRGGMSGEPVVREHGVRGAMKALRREHHHVHACGDELVPQLRELSKSPFLDLRCRICGVLHEKVVHRGLHVALKPHWSDHQHPIGGLPGVGVANARPGGVGGLHRRGRGHRKRSACLGAAEHQAGLVQILVVHRNPSEEPLLHFARQLGHGAEDLVDLGVRDKELAVAHGVHTKANIVLGRQLHNLVPQLGEVLLERDISLAHSVTAKHHSLDPSLSLEAAGAIRHDVLRDQAARLHQIHVVAEHAVGRGDQLEVGLQGRASLEQVSHHSDSGCAKHVLADHVGHRGVLCLRACAHEAQVGPSRDKVAASHSQGVGKLGDNGQPHPLEAPLQDVDLALARLTTHQHNPFRGADLHAAPEEVGHGLDLVADRGQVPFIGPGESDSYSVGDRQDDLLHAHPTHQLLLEGGDLFRSRRGACNRDHPGVGRPLHLALDLPRNKLAEVGVVHAGQDNILNADYVNAVLGDQLKELVIVVAPHWRIPRGLPVGGVREVAAQTLQVVKKHQRAGVVLTRPGAR